MTSLPGRSGEAVRHGITVWLVIGVAVVAGPIWLGRWQATVIASAYAVFSGKYQTLGRTM